MIQLVYTDFNNLSTYFSGVRWPGRSRNKTIDIEHRAYDIELMTQRPQHRDRFGQPKSVSVSTSSGGATPKSITVT